MVQRPLADHAKALAGRAAKNDIHGPVSYAGMVANILAIYVGDASADRCAVGKIELVGGAMDRIIFDGSGNIESGLLEAEAHPARSREQIDADGSFSVASHRTK